MKKYILLFFFLFSSCSLIAKDEINIIFSDANEIFLNKQSPNKLFFKLRKKTQKGEKATAAVLAFPLPFGALGLHRIYLGTKPYVPVVYIGTVGGCFGILPFIDFTMIILDKDVEKFKRNNKVFMWVK